MRISHLGGMEDFGPVDRGDDDGVEYRPFHATWEARIFGIMRVLVAKGVINLHEFRDTVESLPPDQYLGANYYERWVTAIEHLAARHGLTSDG
jgi:nitrile hydratase subunit beta